MWFTKRKSPDLPTAETALPGRDSRPFEVAERHLVLKTPLEGPIPEGYEEVFFGMGCFWGAERLFWEKTGVWSTAVGYQGGHTTNPTYGEVCSGRTGHAETVRVVYDPATVSFAELLKGFLEAHDPTQGMRQGNDVGTQYRSAIYTTTGDQHRAAKLALEAYAQALAAAGKDAPTTELREAPPFYLAEDDHQQYLAKNPWGYCGLAGTGVACPAVATETAGKAPMTAA